MSRQFRDKARQFRPPMPQKLRTCSRLNLQYLGCRVITFAPAPGRIDRHHILLPLEWRHQTSNSPFRRRSRGSGAVTSLLSIASISKTDSPLALTSFPRPRHTPAGPVRGSPPLSASGNQFALGPDRCLEISSRSSSSGCLSTAAARYRGSIHQGKKCITIPVSSAFRHSSGISANPSGVDSGAPPRRHCRPQTAASPRFAWPARHFRAVRFCTVNPRPAFRSPADTTLYWESSTGKSIGGYSPLVFNGPFVTLPAANPRTDARFGIFLRPPLGVRNLQG